MENPLVKEFSFQFLKENALETKDLKDFPLTATAFFFNCLKEKSVYKVTKDFPLTSMADSHNSVYTDRFSGIWAKRILTFGQFWAGGAAAKNFFDLP